MADAPGWPGIEARWTSSAKTGVGSALSPVSRVWFTVSHGILNEIYYPRVDQACTRDFGLIVTDGAGFFAEEKRDCSFESTRVEDGVPAFQVVSTHLGGRFRITKRIVTDPRHDVVLQEIRLEVLEGPPLRLFALLAPHLVNGGAHNTAWADDYKGVPHAVRRGRRQYFARARPRTGRSPPRRSGLSARRTAGSCCTPTATLPNNYDRAADGNVALTAELDLADDAPIHLALGFGRSPAEAAFHARSGLQSEFASVLERYTAGWRTWQAGLRSLDRHVDGHNTYRVSTAVLRCHETPNFPGGFIASLSIPWGASKGDDDLGGYHLVWPRDLVQTAGGFLACGAFEEVRRVLRYLRAVQEADGSWPQNCWLDGKPYWHGLQLDECALPILLVDLAWRLGALRRPQLDPYWPMIRAAAGFVVRNGPTTNQDRWEENAGYTPFTLAAEIAGLLAAADLAELCEDGDRGTAMAGFLRDTADAWEAQIDDWLYVTDTCLGARCRGERLLHPRRPAGRRARRGPRRTPRSRCATATSATRTCAADALVSTDTLALVRFGLRAPDDPRIVDSVRVIDHVLRQELADRPRLAPLQRRRLRRA